MGTGRNEITPNILNNTYKYKMSKDFEDLSSYLDPPKFLLTLLEVVQKKLEDCLFICSSSQHLAKLANKNVHSELGNLDRFE